MTTESKRMVTLFVERAYSSGSYELPRAISGSGRYMNLYQVAEEIARRLTRIFLRDETGRRPRCQPPVRWTGVIARGMHVFATSNAEQILELGKAAAFTEVEIEAPRG